MYENYSYEDYPKDSWGNIVIDIRDDIWSIIGNYPNSPVKLRHLCTTCLGIEVFEKGFHIAKEHDVVKYMNCCERCHAHARHFLILYFQLSYPYIRELILKSGGTYTRKDGLKFRFTDRTLQSFNEP